MPSDDCLVLCSCPSIDSARELAGGLVEQRHAACVSILPGLTSVYAWKGQIESAEESLLLIKTRLANFPELERFIKELHPYEVPEILAIPVQAGSADYLAWLRESVSGAA
ncbi:MAG: divalent-cation tolerance protein CutA [Methylococcus sp.]|nr:MAG: divalent-cation tolerance protein CutA [Methylococcus sp.]